MVSCNLLYRALFLTVFALFFRKVRKTAHQKLDIHVDLPDTGNFLPQDVSRRIILYFLFLFCHWIQCGAIITRSSFSQILTTDTPQLTREGSIWGVCCEFEVWFTYAVITVPYDISWCIRVYVLMAYAPVTLHCQGMHWISLDCLEWNSNSVAQDPGLALTVLNIYTSESIWGGAWWAPLHWIHAWPNATGHRTDTAPGGQLWTYPRLGECGESESGAVWGRISWLSRCTWPWGRQGLYRHSCATSFIYIINISLQSILKFCTQHGSDVCKISKWSGNWEIIKRFWILISWHLFR